jgi:LCP family protein required for cell wall assembly
MARHPESPTRVDDDVGSDHQERPGFVRRYRGWFAAFAALIAVLVGSGAGFALLLNNSLGNIRHVPVTLDEAKRPTPTTSEALNILMLGADAGSARRSDDKSILDDASSGRWPVGKYRSDATMVVHISADRQSVYVVSIPRDSYVKVLDATGQQRSTTKVNAALSLYGPSGAIATVEELTKLRIDHLAMVDWDGFEEITDSLGGVSVTVVGHGTQNLKGKAALKYVRDRFTVPGGDFDRVKRQQNFLRAVLIKLVDRGTLTNPFKLRSTVESVTSNLAVDENWTSGQIRSLALSMRNLQPADVTFMTMPTKGTASDPVAGSIVVVDQSASRKLFDAMRRDRVEEFVAQHRGLLLGAPGHVN